VTYLLDCYLAVYLCLERQILFRFVASLCGPQGQLDMQNSKECVQIICAVCFVAVINN